MTLAELAKVKRILVLGFGVEGRATVEFLRHHFPRKVIGIADKKYGGDYLEKQKKYNLVVKSPGIPKEVVRVPYTTATNIFFANVKGFTIGVTASKGKSTTSALVYSILQQAGRRAHLVGNIGNPMLRELLKSNNEKDIFVCELSSFQLGDIEYAPRVAVFLNFFPEHLDYHGDLKGYWRAKKRIIAHATQDDYFVYNPEYRQLAELAEQTKAKAVPIVRRLPFSSRIIPLIGEHNRENVRAAVTVARLLGVPQRHIITAVKSFRSLPHRLELVGMFNGITFYDDAISTAPEATIRAIEALPRIGTLLLGGQDRGFNFAKLARVISEHNIPSVILFPESGTRILQALKATKNCPPNILETTDMKEAVAFAYANTPRSTICLLSTASPSYSLWKNFEEKGSLFQRSVKKFAHTKLKN